MNPSLSLLVLRASEPEKLAIFYAHLGMQFVKHRHGSGPEHFSSELGNFGFEIYPLKPGETPTTARGLDSPWIQWRKHSRHWFKLERRP
ncbi:hypothetical protein [Prosthecobacter sp.]|uniref:hypothetical protein n=1 Tax=Prosthecobacter sp. TaxID=1965333 RepID=UPI002ABC1EF2|nr:hypothetical protein [Prosthecobacter sp.]MDZ4402959.1 hypothetical protein [Prosthecobacter sp.]